jgi:hypothetical protein
MTPLQRRIARARLLRREGKTYAEIRAVVGDVSHDRLQTWLVGIPRPRETRRSHALTAERRQARRLRMGGGTYDEIATELGVSKASLSLWLRDLPVPERVRERRAQHLRAMRGRGGGMTRERARERMLSRQARAEASIGSVLHRDLFVIGVALYWAEGAKDKPWRRQGNVQFTNSDVDVVAVYLAWLDLLGIRDDERVYTLSIHESADVAAQERWWQDTLALPAANFRRAVIKRHNAKPRRYNTQETYHGCLVINIRRPAALYDAIAGWWRGMSGLIGKRRSPGCVTLGSNLPGSSKGRTASFGVAYGGSNPSPGAKDPGSSPWLPARWWEAPPPVGSGVTPPADLPEPR